MNVNELRGPRWWAAAASSLLAHLVLVICAVVWVAIYSHIINPNQAMSVYHAHAQQSGPVVSLLVGIPLFFGLAKWLGTPQPTRAVKTAIALSMIYFLTDFLILLLVGVGDIPWASVVLSYITKLGAAYWSGWRVAKKAAAPA